MRAAALFLVLCAPTLAFAPRPHVPMRTQPRMASADTAQVRDAFAKVRTAAGLFESGSAAAESAQKIVARLEAATFDSWQQQDLELIDSCLIDEDSKACSEFGAAMIELKDLWDASPGNA